MTDVALTDPAAGAGKSDHKFLTRRNGLLTLLAVLTGFGGFTYRSEIGDTASDLSKRMTRVQLGGVVFEFSRDSIQKAVPLGTFGENAQMNEVADTINGMSDAEIIRLLNVGLLEKLCDFDLGKAKMRQEFESDRRLRDLGLVKIEIDDALRAKVLREIKKQEAEKKQPSEIGYPRLCYRLILTDPGRDVRTALTYSYATNFSSDRRSTKNAPPANLFTRPDALRQASR